MSNRIGRAGFSGEAMTTKPKKNTRKPLTREVLGQVLDYLEAELREDETPTPGNSRRRVHAARVLEARWRCGQLKSNIWRGYFFSIRCIRIIPKSPERGAVFRFCCD